MAAKVSHMVMLLIVIEGASLMTTRIIRALIVAAVALGILVGGAAPYGIPGVNSFTTSIDK